MCIVKANLACRSLKIVPLLLEQHISELKTTKHCCDYSCHRPLPSSPTLLSQEKNVIETSTGDATWFICTWSTVCLNIGGMKNKETISLLPSLFSLASSPSGIFCMNILPTCFFQAFSCCFLAPYAVSLSVIYTTTNKSSASETWLVDERRQLQLNFREFSVTSVINVQCWMCQLSTSVPTSPYCDTYLCWDCHSSPFLPFASRKTLQNLFSPKQGDFQQWLGLWVCLWEANAYRSRYCAYNLERD